MTDCIVYHPNRGIAEEKGVLLSYCSETRSRTVPDKHIHSPREWKRTTLYKIPMDKNCHKQLL